MFEGFFDVEENQDTPSRMKEPPKPRKSNNNFVGLLNQGATCYLNSLIQTLFMTPEFRSKLYKLDEEELGYSELIQADKEEEEEEKRGEKKPINLKEDPLYEPLLNSLREMGFVDYHIDLAIEACNTVSNQEEVMSWLFDNPLPDNWEEEKLLKEQSQKSNEQEVSKKKIKYRRIPIRLQQLFAKLQLSDENAVSSNQLTKSFGWQQNDVGVQHDISELCRILFDALHRSLTGIKGGDIITSIYRGTLVNKIVCLSCGNVKDREEYFQDLVLPVKGEKNILNSLRSYVTPSLLSGDNKYDCEICTSSGKGKQEAKFGVSIRSLPDNLIFSLMRFGFNWESGNRYKINSKLAFPLVIDMSEYLEDSTQLKHYSINKQSDEQINNENSSNTNDNNNSTTQSKTDNQSAEKENTTDQKERKSKKSKSKKKDKVEEDIKLMESTFDPNSQNLYDLLSIVVHSGGAFGGHYYALIRDLINDEDLSELSDENPGKWYEFNDSNVTPVSSERIAKEYGGGSHCAYMLIYRRRNQPIDRNSLLVKVQSTIKEIEENNKLLKEQRELWKVEKQKMTISVNTIEHFDLIDGQFFEKKDTTSSVQNQLVNDDDNDNLSTLPFGDMDDGDDFISMSNFDQLEQNAVNEIKSDNETNGENDSIKSKTIIHLNITKKMLMKDILQIIIQQLRELPNSSEWNVNFEDLSSLRLDRYSISRTGRVIITELGDNFDQTAKKFGITNDASLILWTGKEIAPPKDIQLNVKFYPSFSSSNKKKGKQTDEAIPEAQLFTITLKSNSSILNLKKELVEKTKLAESDQLICTEDEVGVRWIRDDEKLLSELNITDHSTITVERKQMKSGKHPRPISIAMKAFDQKEVKIKVEIIDKIASPETCYSIECNNDLTVEQLKFQVLSLITDKDRYEINSIILRREAITTDLYDDYREYILENKRSIMSYGITNHEKIYLDYMPESTNNIEDEDAVISLQFYVTFTADTREEIESKKKNELFTITISNSSSIKSLKELMIDFLLTNDQFASIPLRDKQFRVRKVNFMLELKEIIQIENNSIKMTEIKDNDILCLEEGKVPNPGEVTVYFQVYQWIEPNEANAIITDQFANLFSAADELPKSFHIYSPTLMRYHQTKTLDNLNDSIYYSDLRVVQIDRMQSLESLKTLYLNTIKNSLLPDHENYRLYNSVNSIDQIRFWASNKLAANNNSTLKKTNIGNGSLITVEFLPDQKTEEITLNDNLLYVYQWILNGDVENSSSPNEYCTLNRIGEVNFTSKNATFEELKEAIHPYIPSIEIKSMTIAKYFYFQTKWMKLTQPQIPTACEVTLSENMSKKEKKAALSQAKKLKNLQLTLQNLRRNDCKLSNGDILIVCDQENELASEIFSYWLETDFKNDTRVPKKPPKRSFEQEAERMIYSASVFRNVALEAGGVAINIGDIEGVPDF